MARIMITNTLWQANGYSFVITLRGQPVHAMKKHESIKNLLIRLEDRLIKPPAKDSAKRSVDKRLKYPAD